MKELILQRGSNKLRGVIENELGEHIVILVHGFTGNLRGPSDIFIKLSSQLQKKGYAVCRYSSIGTLPSEGEFQNMTLDSEVKDLELVIESLQKQGYKRLSLLGESMGGAVVASINTENIKNIIFWYPAFNFIDTDFKELFFSDTARQELRENNYVLCDGFKVGRKFISEVSKINLFENLKNIKNPTLLLHGDQDREVPFSQSETAYKYLAGTYNKLQIIPKAAHCFRKEQEEVIEITVDFMENQVI